MASYFVHSRHAGVYTAEEVALITREKLIRLQSLYIDQFKRLQHLLKEKKRRYLHNRKVEHETLGKHSHDYKEAEHVFFCLLFCLTFFFPLADDVYRTLFYWSQSYCCLFLWGTGSSLLTGPEGLSMKERENLKKLKALRRYRRRYGVEALLHRQLRERRQALSEGAQQVWFKTKSRKIGSSFVCDCI